MSSRRATMGEMRSPSTRRRWQFAACSFVSLAFLTSCGTQHASIASAACVSVQASGVGGLQTVLVPPPPTITRAWRDKQHVYVDLVLPQTPSECPAVSLLVIASSKVDGANQALPIRTSDTLPGDGRPRAYRPGRLHVVL